MNKKFYIAAVIVIVVIVLALLPGLLLKDPAATENQHNRTVWINSQIGHYRYTVTLERYGGGFSAAIVEVRDGVIVSKEPIPDDYLLTPSSIDFSPLAPMEHIFDEIDALIKIADEARVEYDPTYGFPTNIYIDEVINMADDELMIYISEFSILE